MISRSVQEYLKTIYILQDARDAFEAVSTNLVAEKMEVAAASATQMIKRLADRRLVQYTPYRGVELTEPGKNTALEIIRHHRLLELYLKEALGYSWDEVDTEADKLEHVISEDFEDRIDAALDYPTVGVHGEPIPSKAGHVETANYHCLSDLQVGQIAVIRQVSDRSSEMLLYIDEMGLTLGTRVEVRERAPFGGPLVLQVDSHKELVLGLKVAEQIDVAACEHGDSTPITSGGDST